MSKRHEKRKVEVEEVEYPLNRVHQLGRDERLKKQYGTDLGHFGAIDVHILKPLGGIAREIRE